MAELRALPATPEQQAAFVRPVAAGAHIDAASVEQLALKGFLVADLWAGYTPAKYLVKRMLGPSQVTVLFGESGHFKSVIAIDLALCVASGIEFHGIKTHRAGVVYVAGEGHGGLRKRVRAWLLTHGFDASSEQPAIYVTEAGGDLIGNPLQLRATVEHAKRTLGCDVGLVVVDTLAANFGAGDENHAGDMQTAIRGARDAAQGAAVLLLHHTGHSKEGGARERGSYALRATVDYRLRAVYDEPSKLVELAFLRVKDDEEPKPITFVWRRVPLEWQDEDGEELTSVVLELSGETMPANASSGAPRTGTAGLGANQETVLKVLQRLYRVHRKNVEDRNGDPDEARVLIAGLRSDCVPRYMDRRRFLEAVNKLAERDLVHVAEPHILLKEDT